jgi:hypothetical protein
MIGWLFRCLRGKENEVERGRQQRLPSASFAPPPVLLPPFIVLPKSVRFFVASSDLSLVGAVLDAVREAVLLHPLHERDRVEGLGAKDTLARPSTSPEEVKTDDNVEGGLRATTRGRADE